MKSEMYSYMQIIRRISSDVGSIKKFYKHCSIKEQSGGFQLFLDKRILRTPAGTPVILPSEALALAVALEWESQRDYIKLFTMPLVIPMQMQLVNKSLDLDKFNMRHLLAERILCFFQTDSIWQ